MVHKVGDTKTCQFTVATEYAYKDSAGCAIIETTWFNCRVWEGPGFGNIDAIVRGANVHLTGRLKYSRYIDTQGNDRVMYEVIVRELQIMEDRI